MEIKEYLAGIGSKGGKTRAKNLSKEQLSEIGKQGALKRWSKATLAENSQG